MDFRPYESSQHIVDFYKRYLITTFKTNDVDYNQQLEQLLSNDAIYNGPFVCLSNPYKHTVTLTELINDGTVCNDITTVSLFNPADRLFSHQENAIRKYRDGKNLIVTTGTGSGKTKTFMLPVIDQLLREKAAHGGRLPAGVRVLIIYPMNALVNDQMEEWERVLPVSSGITFAHLTSETDDNPEDARKKGHQILASTNYIRFRDEIYTNPPHILVTNYAMLERVLLTPESVNLFTNPEGNLWGTLILDEAHSYKGTLGIEISALLRRLKARVNREHFRFILTSATLGDPTKDVEIAHFGELLCTEPFTNDCIVRSETVAPDPVPTSQSITIPIATYSRMADAIRRNDNTCLCNDLNIPLTSDEDVISRALYDKLSKDTWISQTRNVFFNSQQNGIVKLKDAAKTLQITEDELTDIITVASNAGDDDKRLFEAKYHLFIKGIDGVFITLPPTKKLFLEKMDTWVDNGESYKVFRVSFCHKCGALFLCGRVENNHFIQTASPDATMEQLSVYRIDEPDNETADGTLTICAKCGAVKDAVHGLTCGHDAAFEYTLTCVKKDATNLHTCPCCGNSDTMNSITRPFTAGSDASSSVIGTALYNELPGSKKIHIHRENNHPIIGHTVEDFDEEQPQKKQFLIFTDNRQKAAKFAESFGDSYLGYLLKRLVFMVAQDHPQELTNGIPFSTFASYLTDKMLQYKVYDEDLADMRANNRPYSLDYYSGKAILFLLNEVCGYRAKNSLMKKGGLYFSVQLDYPTLDPKNASILQMMLCQFMKCGAIYADGTLLDRHDHYEFVHHAYNGAHRYGIERNSDLWHPDTVRGFRKSLSRLFNNDITQTDQWLDSMWQDWCSPTINGHANPNYILINQWGNNRPGNTRKVLSTSKIVIKATNTLYQCSTCKNITPYNVDEQCEKPGCNGHLTPFNPATSLKDDHYYWLYRNINPCALNIREHTAQLSAGKAKDYQERFSNSTGGINALSCTTTFEMGVNVGSLQTVFMRNIPPSPANYIQRSGRAGRSKEAASFTVTFCPNSPHDRYYYRYPEKMIGGTITPPSFNVQNKEVLYRHIFAAALSSFWEQNPAMFPEVPAGQRDENSTHHRIGAFISINGFEELKKFLDSHPNVLTQYLHCAFPNNIIDSQIIDNYDWVDYFYNQQDGLITRALTSYNSEHQQLESKKTHFLKLCGDTTLSVAKQREASYSYQSILSSITTLENEDVIAFMSRFTILPKYGFPTDIVSLKGTDSGVELTRSLSLAISEYAPESRLVADKKTYLSRYIEIPSGYTLPRYHYKECPFCSALNRRKNKNDVPKFCDQCHKALSGDTKMYEIPKFGFRIEPIDNKKRNTYEEKVFRSAVYYISNGAPQQSVSYILCGKHIKVSRSKDDTLAILNTKEYTICNMCGYATSGDFPSQHTPWFGAGDPCTCAETHKSSLGYELITDVAILNIEDCPVCEQNKAWTILYALLEGLSKALNIERNEISGCLKLNNGQYAFVLFDTAPGGAGYVKNLVDNPTVLVDMFREAFRVVYTCTCGGAAANVACYSCLCNYGNQRHHDILQRRYAIDFFMQFANDPDSQSWTISNPNAAPQPAAASIFNDYDTVHDINAAVGGVSNYARTSDDNGALDAIRQTITNFNGLEIPKILCTGKWNNNDLDCSLVWLNSHTALFFSSEQASYNLLQTNPDWHCFITGSSFNITALINTLMED